MKIVFKDLPIGFTWLTAMGIATKIAHPADVVLNDDKGFELIKGVGIDWFRLWERNSCLLPKEFI